MKQNKRAKECAGFAKTALFAQENETGSEVSQEGLTDLLTNLRHWCDQQGLDFAEHDRLAYRHYLEEKCATKK